MANKSRMAFKYRRWFDWLGVSAEREKLRGRFETRLGLEPLERRTLLAAAPPLPVPQHTPEVDELPTYRAPMIDRVFSEPLGNGLSFERKQILPPIDPLQFPEPVGPPGSGTRVSGIMDPDGPATFDIVVHYGPDILNPANAAAKNAFDRAVAFWESVLRDPVVVELDADFTGGFSPGVAGSTIIIHNQFYYTDIRTRLIDDAAPNESIVNQLPTPNNLSFSMPSGIILFSPTNMPGNIVMSASRANAKALGFTDLFGGNSSYSLGSKIDGVIKFNSALAGAWDFDPSDGITPGLLDFEGVVIHEIGHLLGFVSEVDTVDAAVGAGVNSVVFPYVLDLFRIQRNQGANFSTTPRVLNTGANIPIQVIHDGQFNVSAFAGVDLDENGIVNANDSISTGDIPMSTGRYVGDGRQASHWKRDEFTGVTIGIMDPTVAPGQLLAVTQTDLRAMGLIGWDVWNTGTITPPGPTVTVNTLTTNDTTPALTGTVTQSGANAQVFVEIVGQFGQNAATLLVDGDSRFVDAFVLTNSPSSADKIVKAQIILKQTGNFGTLYPPTFHNFNTDPTGGVDARDFQAVPSEAAAVGLLSPPNDTLDDSDVPDRSKVLTLTFNDFDPGESLSWSIDVDPGTITGDQMAGGTLIVFFANGLSTAGTLTAIGPANPDASQVTVTMNRAFQATNNGNGTWSLPDNVLPALAAGTYNVRVTAFDSSGARVSDGTTNELVIDLVPPTADVVDVTPDPRSTAVVSIAIDFSEPVQNFDLSDLTLTLDGGPNLLPGGATLTSGNQQNWTLGNLSGLTGADGTYVLTVNVSNITDLAGNALAGPASDTWVKDSVAPTADVVDVTPDPRSTAVVSIAIDFSEPVQNFDLSDLTLTLDGGPNLLPGGATLTSGNQQNWTLGNLSGLTGADGTYVLTVNVSNITDLAGNALAGPASDTWVKDSVAPTADVVDVTPDPRSTAVVSIAIDFSEPVQNFDLSDLTLTLDGGPNLLPGGATLTSGNQQNWTLGNLSGLTGADGTYVLTVNVSNITDLAGNALAGPASDTWVKVPPAPSVDIEDVAPNVRNVGVLAVTIAFTQPVQNFDLSDLTLTLDGGPNLLPGGATLVNLGGQQTWSLRGLDSLTSTNGNYVLTLNTSDIQNLGGIPLTSGDSVSWTKQTPSPINIAGLTTIQAEDMFRRTGGGGHEWWIVNSETPGVGGLTGATGPASDFIQSLTTGAADSATASAAGPAAPYVEYDIQAATTGPHHLRVFAGGLTSQSDSLWIEILGATLLDSEGNAAVGNALVIAPPSNGSFTLRNAGRWSLTSAVHTIRVSMRESGTALDKLVLEPAVVPITPIIGTTTIQAEDVARRVDGLGHRWWIINSEMPGVGGLTGATGPAGYFVQSLTLAGADSSTATTAGPAAPYVEYDIHVGTPGAYRVSVYAGGLSLQSDSLWFEILGGTLLDSEGNATVGSALVIAPPTNGGFTLRNAGRWELPAGSHTIRVSMRESGTAFDRIVVTPVAAPVTPIMGTTTIQAEDITRRVDDVGHRWWIVNLETPGVGGLTGATGPAGYFVQSLTLAGGDSSSVNVAGPAGPYLEYDIYIAYPGAYRLSIYAAGLSVSSDSLWMEVPGAVLLNAEGNSTVGNALLIPAQINGTFNSRNAGRWDLTAGIHTIRVSMRESGTAFDRIVVTPVAAPVTPIIGTTTIQAEDITRRVDDVGHRWWIVNLETPGVGGLTGATGSFGYFVQSLTLTGVDSSIANAAGPAGPYIDFDIQVLTAGSYSLSVRAAGLHSASDSLFVEILGGTLVNAQGNAISNGALIIVPPSNGGFTTKNAGIWSLGLGVFTIRVWMRESGTAIDSLTIGL